MILLILFLACVFIAIGAGLMASVSDMRGLTIPNSHSFVVAGAFFAAYFLLWIGGHSDVFHAFWKSHILAALVVFGVTAFLFATNVMGAADSKLASAFALWMGLHGLLTFLFYTSLTGGLLGLLAILLRQYKPVKNPKSGDWIDRIQGGGNKVPYGVAIAIGALASFLKLGYFDIETLRSFL